MDHIDYFKLQAKNLLKDYSTRFFDNEKGRYMYQSKYFDVATVFSDFGYPDNREDFEFTLMQAQHVVSKIAGFSKWAEMIGASEKELNSGKKQFEKSCYKLLIKRSVLPAPQNLYAFILYSVSGLRITFSFDAVEYAQSYLVYSNSVNDISSAKPLAAGQFSPLNILALLARMSRIIGFELLMEKNTANGLLQQEQTNRGGYEKTLYFISNR